MVFEGGCGWCLKMVVCGCVWLSGGGGCVWRWVVVGDHAVFVEFFECLVVFSLLN